MSTLKVDGIRSNSATSDAITLASNGTCTANLTNKPNRNLIINGAMQVAQRGTSSTNSGYHTIDRFRIDYGNTDEATTQAQADVTSGGAYDAGFRKCLKVTNGNQTNGAGNSDYVQILTRLEAQDIANSGWNYTSTSSFVTLSFWVKSSVAQVFSGSLRALDGTAYAYKFDTPSLSANTWTKVTKTIPGNSNLTFNNDNGNGLDVYLFPSVFSTYASSNANTETWITAQSNTYANLTTSTWYTTNDATFEMTGVQLEVGSVATDFEHRSFGQELALCQRYYYLHAKYAMAGNTGNVVVSDYGTQYTSSVVFTSFKHPVEMRTKPSMECSTVSNGFIKYAAGSNASFNSFALDGITNRANAAVNVSISGSAGHAVMLRTNDVSGAFLAFSAEL